MLQDAHMITGNMMTRQGKEKKKGLMSWKVIICKHFFTQQWNLKLVVISLQTAPVVFCCHKISISFIHSKKKKKKEKQTRNLIFTNILSVWFLHLKMYSFDPLPGVVCLCMSCHPVWYFSSHIQFPQSGQTAVNLTRWRPPVLAYKIDKEKEQTKLNNTLLLFLPPVVSS